MTRGPVFNKAPEGATCSVDTGFPLEQALCGKPAVASWTFAVGDDHDGLLFMCEDCRIEQLKRAHKRDQSAAFEEQFGWPQACDIVGLALTLGRAALRRLKLEAMNAPEVILKHNGAMIEKRKRWVRAWLAHHPPKEGSHIDAADIIIAKNDEAPHNEDLTHGLHLVRDIAVEIDAQRES